MKNAGAKPKSLTEDFFPKQDVSQLGTTLFTSVSAPVDWCTVRQAQMLLDQKVKPDSVLQDIASGRVESKVCSQEEAKQELLRQQQRLKNKERGG